MQDQWCALLCAAKEGYADVCIELLDNGADIEHKDMVGFINYYSFKSLYGTSQVE